MSIFGSSCKRKNSGKKEPNISGQPDGEMRLPRKAGGKRLREKEYPTAIGLCWSKTIFDLKKN